MRLVDIVQGSPEWHAFRLGKISGTRLGTIWSSRQYTKDDVVALLEGRGVEFKRSATKKVLEELLTEDDKELLSTDSAKKLEYYQILADQVAIAPADEVDDDGNALYANPMERGLGEEEAAAMMFVEKTGKTLVTTGCCVSDEDERIMQSPDRLVVPEEGKPVTEAVEIKCLSSAKHLMSFFERKVPEEYWTQKVQYFVVNPDLERLYWVFYDPRVPMLPMFVLVIERADLGHWPDTMLKYQLRTLKELDALTVRLFEESENIILPARADKV